MIGREALRNPDCFIEMSNKLNHTKLKKRTPEEIRKEFELLCQEHQPKSIYLETIKRLCEWDK
jgi:tRNA-dihydrouridine synthase